ncbi:MAG: cytochrome P450 [Actinomycetota bacterium]|nr:cytochrome P450 [Actinomycetota bacterium]
MTSELGTEATVAAEDDFFVRAFADENRRDPYPLYAAERDAGPLLDTGTGAWFAFAHADCAALLRSPHASSDERRSRLFEQFAEHDERLAAMYDEQPSLLFLDPPDHTRLRGLVSRAFTPRVVNRLRDRAREITADLLNAVEHHHGPDDELDLVAALAYPLPVTIICELLGVPYADHGRFGAWSRDMARSVDPSVLRTDEENRRIDASIGAVGEYIDALANERQRDPRDDLLSGLLAVEDDGDRLSRRELIDLAVLLLIAGHETTVNLIGNGTAALLRHPEALTQLRTTPALDRNATDELLRYDSPVQMTQRVAIEPITLHDRTIPPGDQVIVVLGAANRDPQRFAQPDRLWLDRPDSAHHLAFGGGMHHCLGAALARMEGEVAITTLIRRFPNLALAGEPTLRPTFTLRGLEHLPVTLG